MYFITTTTFVSNRLFTMRFSLIININFNNYYQLNLSLKNVNKYAAECRSITTGTMVHIIFDSQIASRAVERSYL